VVVTPPDEREITAATGGRPLFLEEEPEPDPPFLSSVTDMPLRDAVLRIWLAAAFELASA
jgi:hypothetical protein